MYGRVRGKANCSDARPSAIHRITLRNIKYEYTFYFTLVISYIWQLRYHIRYRTADFLCECAARFYTYEILYILALRDTPSSLYTPSCKVQLPLTPRSWHEESVLSCMLRKSEFSPSPIQLVAQKCNVPLVGAVVHDQVESQRSGNMQLNWVPTSRKILIFILAETDLGLSMYTNVENET